MDNQNNTPMLSVKNILYLCACRETGLHIDESVALSLSGNLTVSQSTEIERAHHCFGMYFSNTYKQWGYCFYLCLGFVRTSTQIGHLLPLSFLKECRFGAEGNKLTKHQAL